MTQFFTFWVKIMALISSLYNYYIINAREIAFLIFISNLLLLYFSKSSIFNFINVLSVLITVAAAAVAAATFAAIKVYEVVVACVGVGFLSLFIVSFISWSYFFILSLYLSLSYLISLITVFNWAL